MSPEVITALIGAGGLVGAALITTIPTFRRLRRIETKQAAIGEATSQINRAVNHVGPGEPTLIERVKHNERQDRLFRVWIQDALVTVATQVGVSLPRTPPELLHTVAPPVPPSDPPAPDAVAPVPSAK